MTEKTKFKNAPHTTHLFNVIQKDVLLKTGEQFSSRKVNMWAKSCPHRNAKKRLQTMQSQPIACDLTSKGRSKKKKSELAKLSNQITIKIKQLLINQSLTD